MTSAHLIRVGVLADTHGLFDPAIPKYFRNVNHIIHAGDIGKRSVIEQLEAIAPVTVVSGNVDGYEQSGFPPETVISLAGRRIAVRHILYVRWKVDQRRTGISRSDQAGHLCFRPHPSAKERMVWRDTLIQSWFSRSEAIQIAQDVGNDHDRRTTVGETRSFERSDDMISKVEIISKSWIVFG